MKKVVGVMIGLLPVSAFGECVPVPDCASIGYTETSCDGDSLKCPFDTTKLYCPPCDSSYKYTCSGDNIKNPIGDTCNDKYAACECVAGATFFNGKCICDTSCDTIGNIVYSDRTCSSCNITDKTPVGIIAYKDNNKHLMIGLNTSQLTWYSGSLLDIAGLPNYNSSDLALLDFAGYENTQIIVQTFGETSTDLSAVYCYNYAPIGLENSKGNWYLPATGELYHTVFLHKDEYNKSLNILGLGNMPSWVYWSSSEKNDNHAWLVNDSTGMVASDRKSLGVLVVCLMSLR